MNSEWLDPEFNEPERYELRAGPYYHFELDRRQFVQMVGAGLLLSVVVPDVLAQRARGGGRTPDVFERLHIGADGVITVLTSKVEVGQGSRTQLIQAAAEELRLPIDRIRLIMADTAVVPDDGGTAGSRTTPSTVPSVRRGCAAARELLVKAAAARFDIEPGNLSVRDGNVDGLGAGNQFGYADLAREKRESLPQTSAAEIHVAPVEQWRVLGTSAPKVGAVEIVTGAHEYPSDIRRPRMWYGKILRPPSYGAQLLDIDLKSAESIEDVVAVRDGDFVGFTAPTSFDAERACDAAAKTANWKLTTAHPSSDELYAYLRAHASNQHSRREARGEPERALESASNKLSASYDIAYIQHAPMEPRAAVAEWGGNDKLVVWIGTQQPSRVREELARAFRMNRDRIRVIVPDTGGGFGGKHSGEVAVEAARLAMAAKRPVSVRWSREEEFTWAYFRPAGVIDVAAALNSNGGLAAWNFVNFNSGASAIAMPYRVPNVATEFRSCDAPLRSGSYRALASTANNFARESFMDELAHASGADPLEFRLRHLDHDRIRAVLIAAAERFRWKEKWKPHKSSQRVGVGLACGTEKASYVACCVTVEVDERRRHYRVVDVCEAFECGAIQNPANLKAQVEGCIVQGLGGAVSEEIRFKDGKISNPRFSQYAVPRFRDVPKIETVLVNRPDLESVGAGETPIIGIAPAIANALFNATGVRIRSLPIRNSNYRSA